MAATRQHFRQALTLDVTSQTINSVGVAVTNDPAQNVQILSARVLVNAITGTVGFTDAMGAVGGKAASQMSLTLLSPAAVGLHTSIHFAGSLLDSGAGQSNVKNLAPRDVELMSLTPDGGQIVIGGYVYCFLGALGTKATAPILNALFVVEYQLIPATIATANLVSAQT